MSKLGVGSAVASGDVSVAALAWRFRGAVRVTAIAKVTFAFAPDGVMPRLAPQPIFRAEVHHANNVANSIRFASDLAPYLNRADVVFTGRAYLAPGAPGSTQAVRLGVFSGGEAVLDKTVIVRRRARETDVPLVYERAFGGTGWADNPLGVGAAEGSGEPSLIHPSDARRPAGFGPIGRGWMERKRRLGALKRLVLDGAGVVALPDDFDWEYFQAAPADQRIPFLRGDEWIVMAGLHPRHAHLRTRLPSVRGLGLVYGLAQWGVADGQSLALHVDGLCIDGDEERCTLTLRGTFPVADEAALGAVRVMMGVELPGQPVAWPDPASLPAAEAGALPPRDLAPSGDVRTAIFDFSPAEEQRPPAGRPDATVMAASGTASPALPFQGSSSVLSALLQPGPRRAPRAGGDTVLHMPEEGTDTSRSKVLPFDEAWPARAPPPAADARPLPPRDLVFDLPGVDEKKTAGRRDATVVDMSAPTSPVLPFQGSSAAPSALRQPSPRRAPRAGGDTVVHMPEDTSHAKVLPFQENAPAAPPPDPVPPPDAPAPEAAPEPPKAWSWAAAPEPAVAPVRPPPPPPPAGPRAVSPVMKKGLYERFGGKR